MNLVLRTALSGLAMAACAGAVACDAALPRCKQLNELVGLMQYKSSLSEMQMTCRGRAAVMSPDTLATVRPALLMGLTKEHDTWPAVMTSYDAFLDEACGGPEMVYLLLGGYQVAWNSQLPGRRLDEALARFREEGRAGIQEDADAVSAQVNRVLGPLLSKMGALALSNYSAKIKGIVSGKAESILAEAACVAQTEDGLALPPGLSE